MITLNANGVYLLDGKTIAQEAALGKDEARENTITYQILRAHDVNGSKGTALNIRFDAMVSHDITYVGILKGLDYSIDGEVLRLLKAMPRWIPATKNGEPVRYKVSMPITIRASRNKNQKSSTALRDFKDQ